MGIGAFIDIAPHIHTIKRPEEKELGTVDLSACRRRQHKLSVPGVREVFGDMRSSKNAQPHEFPGSCSENIIVRWCPVNSSSNHCHSRGNGNPDWVPAFAGMTKKDKFPDTNLEEGDLRCHAEEVSIPKGERPLVRELGGFGCELETSRRPCLRPAGRPKRPTDAGLPILQVRGRELSRSEK